MIIGVSAGPNRQRIPEPELPSQRHFATLLDTGIPNSK